MTRVLLALVLAAGLTAAANAAVVAFSVDGVPTYGQPVEVRPSDWLEVGIWIGPDFPLESFTVDFYDTGPWIAPEPLPKVDFQDLGPAGTGDVRWVPPEPSIPDPPWDPGLSDARWFSDWGVWSIGGFISGTELFEGPGVVAEFDVHIADYPESTILNLEIDFVELVGPTGYEDMPDVYPLVLHVTPEPATIGLLVLGGLAALRRRST
jgi:hypothetical protein